MFVTNRCLWSGESASRHGNIGKAIGKSHCQMINLNTENTSDKVPFSLVKVINKNESEFVPRSRVKANKKKKRVQK